jgi:hypothetical protein
MFAYARQRASAAVGNPRTAVLITSGPAGVQTGEFRCAVSDLRLYLLVPQTSDHLFNLEHEATVTALTATCELKGQAQIISCAVPDRHLTLCQEPDAEWCALVRVEISRVQIRSEDGWRNGETLDL